MRSPCLFPRSLLTLIRSLHIVNPLSQSSIFPLFSCPSPDFYILPSRVLHKFHSSAHQTLTVKFILLHFRNPIISCSLNIALSFAFVFHSYRNTLSRYFPPRYIFRNHIIFYVRLSFQMLFISFLSNFVDTRELLPCTILKV